MTAKLAPLYTKGLDLCKKAEIFDPKEIKIIDDIVNARTPSAQDKAQCKTNIHIGIFFDGTRNNYVDYEASGKDSFTNVCRLYTMYPGRGVRTAKMGKKDSPINKDTELKPSVYDNYFKIYVPGVGTRFITVGDKNSGSLGAAAGNYGLKRINWALTQVLQSLHRYFKKDAELKSLNGNEHSGEWISLARKALAEHMPDKSGKVANKDPGQVKKIYISVFGFSRGSVAARTFSNKLIGMLSHDAHIGKTGFPSLLNIPVQFDFLGIFDSVASVGTAGITSRDADDVFNTGHMEWGNALGQRISSRIKKCVHLVAAHEIRRCFPVDSVAVNGSLPGNCEEHLYPGVHSDVGGGYGVNEQGKSVGSSIASNALSRMPLVHMYRAARLAGVPLRAEEVIEKHKDRLKLSGTLVTDFNNYLKLFSTKSGSLPALMKEQYHMYLKWRLTWVNLNTNDALRANQSGLKSAIAADVNDLREANIEFALELAQFKKWRQAKTTGKTIKTYYGSDIGQKDWGVFNKNWHSIEGTLPTAAKVMFANYVHDSRAWFKLDGQEAEEVSDAYYKKLEQKQAAYKKHNDAVIAKYKPDVPPPEELMILPPKEMMELGAYKNNKGKIDGVKTISSREPGPVRAWGALGGVMQRGGGYLRYRVIYMGGDKDCMHSSGPPPVKTNSSNPSRKQAAENYRMEFGDID